MTTKTPVARKATPKAKTPVAAPVAPVETREESAATLAVAEATPPKKTPEEKAAEKEAKKAELAALLESKKQTTGLTGDQKEAYPPAVRKSIVDGILELIGNPDRLNGIAIGGTTWTVKLAIDILRLMRGEGVQRDISWEQVRILASCMRSALDDTDHGVKWYPATNIVVISDDNHGIDGRHRDIAFVCCFGTDLEIDEMLRVIHNHTEQPVDKEGNCILDPADLLKLPILGWETNKVGTPDELKNPNWPLAFSIGVDRGSFSVIDGYQKERTAADALCTYPESAHVLSMSGIPAKTMATAIGETFLRANLSYTKDDQGKEVKKYGSLKVSNPERHPSRAPLYSHLFAGKVVNGDYQPGLIANAHKIVSDTTSEGMESRTRKTGYTFDETRLQAIGYYHVLSVSALVMDAYDNGDEIVAQLVRDLCEAPQPNEKGEDLRPCAHLQRYLQSKSYLGRDISKCFLVPGKTKADITKRVLRSSELYTGLVLCVTMPEAELTQSEFIQACDQEQLHRIEGGIDDNGIDHEAVAVAEKLIYGKKSQVRSNKKRK